MTQINAPAQKKSPITHNCLSCEQQHIIENTNSNSRQPQKTSQRVHNTTHLPNNANIFIFIFIWKKENTKSFGHKSI